MSRMVRLGNIFVCCVLLCASALAADQKSPTKLSDLPPEAQQAISAALARNGAGIQDFTLTASDGMNNDQFGMSVSIDGNTVVVGANQAGRGPGAAYVFVKPPSGWANMTQTAELTASDGELKDCFGCSVAISGNTIVVGDFGLEVNGNVAQGAAYVFVEPPTGWANMTETAKLTASDGVSEAQFGSGVGISGNTVVVGAPGTSPMQGEAYVFVEPRGGWKNMTQTAKLVPSDGFDSDNFGLSVSIGGKTVLVGSPDAGSGAPEVGRGYIFVEPAGDWKNMTQTAELMASDGQIGNAFAWSVSINGKEAVIGAPDHPESGAAYVFVEPSDGWTDMTETAELQSGVSSSCMGWSTSIDGKVVIAGSQCNTGFKGAAFVFLEPAQGWKNTSTPTFRLSIPFTYNQDYFGSSVSISGQTALVGAPYAPTSPPRSQPGPGQAFIFMDK
jgi:hypothetical protein